MNGPIGGFFQLRLSASVPARSILSAWSGNGSSAWLLHNARSALHGLWKLSRPRQVWLPAYVCSEVVTSVPAGSNLRYYPLSKTLSPDVDFLEDNLREGDHLLAVDYFGRLPNDDFAILVRSRPDIGWVEDRAHALDPLEGAWGDWLLYSPRKLVGVPDGGILIARQKSLPIIDTVAATDLSFMLPALERFEDVVANQRWYATYLREEARMSIGIQRMSHLSLEILRASDIASDGSVRRRNYEALHGRLAELAFFPEAKIGFAPMGFPLRVKSAATLSLELADVGIFAARHWQNLPSDPSLFAREHQLSRELLTLPCDYRYDEADMHRVADAVRNAMNAQV